MTPIKLRVSSLGYFSGVVQNDTKTSHRLYDRLLCRRIAMLPRTAEQFQSGSRLSIGMHLEFRVLHTDLGREVRDGDSRMPDLEMLGTCSVSVLLYANSFRIL